LNLRAGTSAVALAALGAAVSAASSAPSPKALALRSFDFPAGAKRLVIIDESGPGGKAYAASFNFKVGVREEEVTDQVWYVPNNAKAPVPGLAAGPKVTYANEVGTISGFTGEKSLTLPRYGDEQTAKWADYKNSDGAERARAALVVRKGNVIWTLIVEDCGVISTSGCALGPMPPKITQAQAVAELKKYAAMQKARIGNG
jgi:hypothetical protein